MLAIVEREDFMRKLLRKSIVVLMSSVICLMSSAASAAEKQNEINILTYNDKFIIIYDSSGKFDMIETEKEKNPEIKIICTSSREISSYRWSEILDEFDRGDLNNDGEINIEDVSIALKGMLGIEELSEEQREQIDLYSVGFSNVSLIEVTDILDAALGLYIYDNTLPEG